MANDTNKLPPFPLSEKQRTEQAQRLAALKARVAAKAQEPAVKQAIEDAKKAKAGQPTFAYEPEVKMAHSSGVIQGTIESVKHSLPNEISVVHAKTCSAAEMIRLVEKGSVPPEQIGRMVLRYADKNGKSKIKSSSLALYFSCLKSEQARMIASNSLLKVGIDPDSFRTVEGVKSTGSKVQAERKTSRGEVLVSKAEVRKVMDAGQVGKGIKLDSDRAPVSAALAQTRREAQAAAEEVFAAQAAKKAQDAKGFKGVSVTLSNLSAEEQARILGSLGIEAVKATPKTITAEERLAALRAKFAKMH